MAKKITQMAKISALSLLIVIMLFLNKKIESTFLSDIFIYGVVLVSLILINYNFWKQISQKDSKKGSF